MSKGDDDAAKESTAAPSNEATKQTEDDKKEGGEAKNDVVRFCLSYFFVVSGIYCADRRAPTSSAGPSLKLQ